MGVFIVFEGINGSGKSTQAQLLANWLQQAGKKVLLTKEPSTSAWGVLAKMLSMITTSDIVQRLFARDRKAHLKRVILPALRHGYVVVCDRYLLSSIAYAKNEKLARRLNAHFIQPDITIVLDLPVGVALHRLKVKTSAFEKKSVLERARQRYLKERAIVVSAGFNKMIVFGKIKDKISRLL